jgi:hypothetical protein
MRSKVHHISHLRMLLSRMKKVNGVGEHAKIARGKGGRNKSPCCVSWADETQALSCEKMRQGPTPRHANKSLEGICKHVT